MRTLRLQLRFLIPLVLTLVAAAYFAVPLMDQLTLRWFARDLNSRGALVTNTLSDSIADALDDAKGVRLQVLFDRAVNDERLFAIGLCSLDGTLLRRTASFPRNLTCPDAAAAADLPDPRLGIALITVVVAQLSWRGWIAGARGSGSADRQAVDARDRVPVPPGKNEYLLRRIWLSAEEEQGYYYGFANEGMWPLCHVAHVRPVFRESDWETSRAVNQRFADAVVAEARREDPVVLVQDYHFALLPAMIRAQLPRATILMFWHIPWPNPESFGICPWRREILQGMLGSTILGFHTRFHCKNFIETVDRFLEARIEHEYSSISFQDKETLVENYPISIEWPTEDVTAAWPSVADCRRKVFERLHLPSETCLAVGVDRFDYTKGILERLHAVERLLEKRPEWIGRFVFVQVAARNDERVLVLSRFAGAARELTEALIVNPYHVEETADALHRAATMPEAEQRERMASLRMTVREFNVFRWAGHMLADAGRWHLRERIEARVQQHRTA